MALSTKEIVSIVLSSVFAVAIPVVGYIAYKCADLEPTGQPIPQQQTNSENENRSETDPVIKTGENTTSIPSDDNNTNNIENGVYNKPDNKENKIKSTPTVNNTNNETPRPEPEPENNVQNTPCTSSDNDNTNNTNNTEESPKNENPTDLDESIPLEVVKKKNEIQDRLIAIYTFTGSNKNFMKKENFYDYKNVKECADEVDRRFVNIKSNKLKNFVPIERALKKVEEKRKEIETRAWCMQWRISNLDLNTLFDQ